MLKNKKKLLITISLMLLIVNITSLMNVEASTFRIEDNFENTVNNKIYSNIVLEKPDYFKDIEEQEMNFLEDYSRFSTLYVLTAEYKWGGYFFTVHNSYTYSALFFDFTSLNFDVYNSLEIKVRVNDTSVQRGIRLYLTSGGSFWSNHWKTNDIDIIGEDYNTFTLTQNNFTTKTGTVDTSSITRIRLELISNESPSSVAFLLDSLKLYSEINPLINNVEKQEISQVSAYKGLKSFKESDFSSFTTQKEGGLLSSGTSAQHTSLGYGNIYYIQSNITIYSTIVISPSIQDVTFRLHKLNDFYNDVSDVTLIYTKDVSLIVGNQRIVLDFFIEEEGYYNLNRLTGSLLRSSSVISFDDCEYAYVIGGNQVGTSSVISNYYYYFYNTYFTHLTDHYKTNEVVLEVPTFELFPHRFTLYYKSNTDLYLHYRYLNDNGLEYNNICVDYLDYSNIFTDYNHNLQRHLIDIDENYSSKNKFYIVLSPFNYSEYDYNNGYNVLIDNIYIDDLRVTYTNPAPLYTNSDFEVLDESYFTEETITTFPNLQIYTAKRNTDGIYGDTNYINTMNEVFTRRSQYLLEGSLYITKFNSNEPTINKDIEHYVNITSDKQYVLYNNIDITFIIKNETHIHLDVIVLTQFINGEFSISSYFSAVSPSINYEELLNNGRIDYIIQITFAQLDYNLLSASTNVKVSDKVNIGTKVNQEINKEDIKTSVLTTSSNTSILTRYSSATSTTYSFYDYIVMSSDIKHSPVETTDKPKLPVFPTLDINPLVAIVQIWLWLINLWTHMYNFIFYTYRTLLDIKVMFETMYQMIINIYTSIVSMALSLVSILSVITAIQSLVSSIVTNTQTIITSIGTVITLLNNIISLLTSIDTAVSNIFSLMSDIRTGITDIFDVVMDIYTEIISFFPEVILFFEMFETIFDVYIYMYNGLSLAFALLDILDDLQIIVFAYEMYFEEITTLTGHFLTGIFTGDWTAGEESFANFIQFAVYGFNYIILVNMQFLENIFGFPFVDMYLFFIALMEILSILFRFILLAYIIYIFSCISDRNYDRLRDLFVIHAYIFKTMFEWFDIILKKIIGFIRWVISLVPFIG